MSRTEVDLNHSSGLVLPIAAGSIAVLAGLGIGGCVPLAPAPEAPLFTAPLIVEGRPPTSAILDTGGGYEVLLRDDFGLTVVGQIQVLAFGGFETVELTEGFRFSVGGVEAQASFALTGLSVCDCNGVGYPFFQKTGVVLGLDFSTARATFLEDVPPGGVTLEFVDPPDSLPGFATAFIDVEVGPGFDPPMTGSGVRVRALLDTGANRSALQRRVLDDQDIFGFMGREVTIGHPALGVVGASVLLFDTEGLPDLIVGTDVMGTWGREWYFAFAPGGGAVTVVANPTPQSPVPTR